LNGAQFDCRQGVCDGKVRVIVRVDSKWNIRKFLFDGFYGALDAARQAPSVCVAKNDAFSASLHCLSNGGKSVLRIGVESIKKMFRVVEDGFALLPQK